MANTDDEIAIAQLLGILYTEVFQAQRGNPNRPLNRTSHGIEFQGVSDNVKTNLFTATNTHVWGPGGFSDEVNATPMASRWGMGAVWQ